MAHFWTTFLNVIRNLIDGYFWKLWIKRRSVIENKITNQELFWWKVVFFLSVWRIFSYFQFELKWISIFYKYSWHVNLVPYWHSFGVSSILPNDNFLRNSLTKTWLNLSEVQSNDVTHLTYWSKSVPFAQWPLVFVLVQKCVILFLFLGWIWSEKLWFKILFDNLKLLLITKSVNIQKLVS